MLSRRARTCARPRQRSSAATTALRPRCSDEIGGEAGLEAFNQLIGLTDTDVGSNGYWGLTQTTAADQIRLLQVVFGEDSVLDGVSRRRTSSR